MSGERGRSCVDNQGAAELFSLRPMNIMRWTIGSDTLHPGMPLHGEVHLWWGRWSGSDSGSATLCEEEKQRALRFRLPGDGARYRWTRAELRRVLAGYVGCAPQEVEFTADESGKPHVSQPPTGVQFNLSHSGEMLLIGVASGQPVGVDVERIKPCPMFREISRRCFTVETVERVTDEAVFFEEWTRMEACLKGQGLGIARGARSAVPAGWEVQTVHMEAGYVGAVALGGME